MNGADFLYGPDFLGSPFRRRFHRQLVEVFRLSGSVEKRPDVGDLDAFFLK